MHYWTSFCLLIKVALITLTYPRVIFVQKNGWDHDSCGTGNEPCGTLYFASILTNTSGFEIYVNGQNESQITYYMNNTHTGYHPCLTKPFHDINNIIITFNHSLIHNMMNWYPPSCTEYDINDAANEYMFSAFDTTLIINNLHIDLKQYTNITFGLINVMNDDTSIYNEINSLQCNDCHFRNIYNNTHPMIYSIRSITFNHCIFTSMESISSFIVLETLYLTMNDITVRDSIFNPTFITIQNPGLDYYLDLQNVVILMNSHFMNISSQIAIINEEWISCDLMINNVSFIDINDGGVYHARYTTNAVVNILNINISTPQITKDYSLFDFYYASFVDIKNIRVDYMYNIITNCRDIDNDTNIDNETWLNMRCFNPISLIQNVGSTMNLMNIDFSFSVTSFDIESLIHTKPEYDYVYMKYVDDSYIIMNSAVLTIYNCNIYGLPFNSVFIKNLDRLSIDRFCVIIDNHYPYFDPNALQSEYIIQQIGVYSIMNVSNSKFIGGGFEKHISIESGSATISNTTFQFAGHAVYALDGIDIRVSDCTFDHIGRYWVDIAQKSNVYLDFFIMDFKYVDTVIIEGNDFIGFEDKWQGVFIHAESCDDIILRNNRFALQLDEWYVYDVNPYIDPLNVLGLLYFWENTKISIYRNDFYKNDINPQIPWLYFIKSAVPSCLSANNFTNFVFWILYDSIITSCFRESLYLCIDDDCSDDSYGNINPQLHDEMSYINIDTSLSSFFKAYDSSFALDNIQFNIVSDESWEWIIDWGVHLFILDSIFPPNLNISLAVPNCNLSDHVRLNNTNYIAKLRVSCWKTWSWWPELTYVVPIADAQYTNHLSATQIHFNATSETYFPGQKLTFNHQIYDKLGNRVHYYWYNDSNISNPSQVIVRLESTSSDSLDWSQNFPIKQNGLCEICASGVIILSVALYESYNDMISMETSILSNNLVSIFSNIELGVISCPVGYGPDGNHYQCHICQDGTYNLSPNNNEMCKPCDEENNNGVICQGGNVYVEEDYWLGFVGVDDSMATGICPSLYCCNKRICNYYEEQETLCATNRDSSVPLCGKCKGELTESINSPQCMECHTLWLWWLLKPLILSILYTIYLIAFNGKKGEVDNDNNNIPKELSRFQRMKALCTDPELLLLGQSLVLRVLLFYEQALGDILWPSTTISYFGYVYTVASIFSLEMSIAFPSSEPQCFIKGLTSKEKILLGLLPWSMITVFLGMICLFETLRVYLMPNKFIILNTNFSKAFMSLLIICVSQLLSVLFKLLNCQTIGAKRVHFYFGEEECFETWTMVISILFVAFVAVIFIILWFCLHRKTAKERENKNSFAYNLCKYYKKECYFWEFVILIRRAIISLYAILYTSTWFATILVAILFFFLTIHNKYKPFAVERANIAEYYSLCFTILVITIQTTTTTNIGSIDYATAIVLSIFIILPVIIVSAIILNQILMHTSLSSSSSSPSSSPSSKKQERIPLKSPPGVAGDNKEEERDQESMVELQIPTIPHTQRPGTMSLPSFNISMETTISKSISIDDEAKTPLNKEQ